MYVIIKTTIYIIGIIKNIILNAKSVSACNRCTEYAVLYILKIVDADNDNVKGTLQNSVMENDLNQRFFSEPTTIMPHIIIDITANITVHISKTLCGFSIIISHNPSMPYSLAKNTKTAITAIIPNTKPASKKITIL